MSLPLSGRVALVTGVSRGVGIGVAVAERLVSLGASVYATGWPPHDVEQPWGEDPIAAPPFLIERHDLADPAVPGALIDATVARFGAIDVVVAVHARSSHHALAELDAAELDLCWAVNVRSVVLLAQRFAAAHDPGRVGGRMLWFTSGQHLAPMEGELPYSVTKGALHQLTQSLATEMARHGIAANCINPGPVDTGYLTGADHARVAAMFPSGRWGSTADVANLVAFLVSDQGAWIQGQVLNSEGGFNRYAH